MLCYMRQGFQEQEARWSRGKVHRGVRSKIYQTDPKGGTPLCRESTSPAGRFILKPFTFLQLIFPSPLLCFFPSTCGIRGVVVTC
ncbi:unnamed protein product [Heterosigma akashiwo]